MKIKIQQAERAIEMALRQYHKPAIMWSSGKDSMALLHLLRHRLGHYDLPVIFHRDPFFASRYEFANKIIRDWNLTVYDWAPSRVAVAKARNQLSLMEYYQIGPKETCELPVDLYEPEDDSAFVCGLRDVYARPKGSFDYPWDLVMHGHKSCDVDPLYGAVPLSVDIKQNIGAPAAVFPLRNWSHADVWEYIESEDVPWQTDRYEKLPGGTYRERADRRHNPDYLPGCTRCMDRDQPASVFCPKLGMDVSNVSAQLDYVEVKPLDYFKEQK